MKQVFHIFIGYDEREHNAYRVCDWSLRKHFESDDYELDIGVIDSHILGFFGYDRPYRKEGNQFYDVKDGRPFSTSFSFARFGTPILYQVARQPNSSPWVLFVDCDFLFNVNPAMILDECLKHPDKALMVVQNNYAPDETVKMDGMKQERYYRKNWSSLMVFNMDHPAIDNLTMDVVSNASGRMLHTFGWLDDDEIGALTPAWNWIEGTSEGVPYAVHYTAGGPWFPHMQDVAYAEEWRKAFRSLDDV